MKFIVSVINHFKFGVVDSGDEKEAETEAAAAVSVAIGDDLEALEDGDDVFARRALAGDCPVSGFVDLG